ncbi:serine hydrolase domain-containing protein [Paludifilum halophilum]|uniref:Beta-lactamase-related domain-containing protein n=1 Tax=Paludifilum halophilum TaxID=1642702 RepID=A0A235BA37_9BACL|nr:serine hydrolase domain-containing protein [Paludifilum halophilum]OYD09092.1 hypothetical protein CHM34_04825 [Paludifilum halophilum]
MPCLKSEGMMEAMKQVKAIFTLLCIGSLFTFFPEMPAAWAAGDSLPVNQMEQIVKKRMDEGKIPGMAVVVVRDDQVDYKKGFGYADRRAQRPVTPSTLFEIGSTTKAFTGLAVLQLEKQGLIRLQDPVSRYLPWFHLHYKGKKQPITIEQLLHHTSGIPFESIGRIPAGSGEDALENTVRTLVGGELKHPPGKKYHYATINYDVLGLIIQQVTGQPYETYMRKQVIQPLGLRHTYVGRQDGGYREPLAQGYKIGFLGPRLYKAPTYRGNTPAGYIITNADDVAQWLKVQLKTERTKIDQKLIDDSHRPDRSVRPSDDGAFYGAGWMVRPGDNGELFHGGSNPNYSSFFIVRPEDRMAVGILANLNSAHAHSAAREIMNAVTGARESPELSDSFQPVDKAAVGILSVLAPILLLVIIGAGMRVRRIVQGKRRFVRLDRKRTVFLGLAAGLSVLFFLSIYNAPKVLFQGLPWDFVKVWGPSSVMVAVGTVLFLGSACFFYTLLTLLTVQADDHTAVDPGKGQIRSG